MSYDVHITRAEYWAENEDAPIPLEEWIATATLDERLDARGGGLFVAPLIRSDEEDAAFHWDDGDVFAADPDENTLQLMRDLARTLDAKVQGDDGEHY